MNQLFSVQMQSFEPLPMVSVQIETFSKDTRDSMEPVIAAFVQLVFRHVLDFMLY